MVSRVRRRRYLVVAVVSLMTSCSPGAGGAAPTPSDAHHGHDGKVSSVPPDASPSPPARPRDVRERSERGAEAFTRYYFAVMDHAFASGDTSTFERLSSPGCTSCHGLIGSIRTVYDSGGQIRGGATILRSVRLDVLAGGDAEVDVTFDSARYLELDASGAVMHVENGRRNQRAFVELHWTARGWRATHVADA